MYGGGMVNAKQYGTGGMVNQYQNGGQAMSNLKPVPDNNPGLGKLPEDVRNKMGYMQEGGEVSPEMLMDLARIKNLNYTQPSFRFPRMESLNNLDLSDAYMDSVRSGGNTGMFDRLRSLSSSFGQKNDSSGKRYKPLSDEEILDFYNQLKKSSMMESKEDGGLMEMMHGGKAKKKKEMYSYEDGGLSGYQDGGQPQQDDAQVQAMMQQQAMMQREQPSPFVPFDQRPPSSGDTMSSIPMGMQQGDYMRSLRGELEMENKELTRDKMQNFLERLRLDSLSEKLKLDSLSERIERSPQDSMYYRNTPQQDYFMDKYREEMINPNYFPEGN